MGKTLDFFKDNGQIDNVSHCAKCKYSCCITDDDNFIVLFPWETDAARRVGLSLDHLESIKGNPEFVHCARPCTGPNDYKPVNCATYPLYPITEDLNLWVRGAKSRCPIADIKLCQHIKVVSDGLRKIEKNYPGSIKTLVYFIRNYPGALEIFEYDMGGKKLSSEQIAFAQRLLLK